MLKEIQDSIFHEYSIEGDEFNITIGGLVPNTTYSFYAFVETQNYGVLVGDTLEFITTIIKTFPAENITYNSAFLKAEFHSGDISGIIIGKGFEIKPENGASFTIDSDENAFQSSAEDLLSSTNYIFKAYVYSLENGIVYGNEEAFQTLNKTSSKQLQMSNHDRIKIYPNLTSDWLTIDGINNSKKLSIIDYSGRIYLTVRANNKDQISVENLENGNYLVLFKDQNKTIVKKLVKH
nr:T9SS type A sorting domain-containing protein [uncultured Draconibacterium sp.]